MSSVMILWLPIIMLRSFVIRRNTLFIDGVLLLAGVVCILTLELPFEIKASWPYLPVYILFAMVVYLVSVGITSSHPMQYLRQLSQAIQYRKLVIHKLTVWNALITALPEEIVWRVIFQTILSATIGIYASVAVVAVSFSLLHRSSTSGFTIQFVELLTFSLVLGMLFALTHDVLLIIAMHAIRNYFIGIKGAVNERW